MDFGAQDQSVTKTALDLLDKAVEKASKACAVIGVPTTPVDLVEANATELRRILNTNLERPQWTVKDGLLPTLRVALSLLIEKLGKMEEDQLALGVTPDDTGERLAEAKRVFNMAKADPRQLSVV